MNVKHLRLISAVTLLCLLSSCQSKDDLTQDSISEGNTVLSLTDRTLLPCGSSFMVAFTADAEWQLKNCPDWLIVNKKSGRAGTTTLKFSASCNESRKDRSAVVTFKADDGSFSSDLKVSQPFPYLRVNTDSLSFDWNDCRTERDGVVIDNNPQVFSISSNVGWRVEVLDSKTKATDFEHFTLSEVEGKGDGELSVIPIRDNYNKAPYDMTVRLYAVNVDKNGVETRISEAAVDSYVLKLHQKNLRFLINDSVDDIPLEYNELNDAPAMKLTLDSELPWRVSQCPSWMVVSEQKGEGVKTISLLPDGPNPACKSRSGVIRFSTDVGAYRVISVSQKPYVFSVDVDSVNMTNDDTSEYRINLKTTGTWAVDDVPSWLSVYPTECMLTTSESGVDTHEIVISATGQNLSFEDLNGILHLRSSMNDLVQEVNVSQDKFIFDVSASSVLASLPTFNTLKYDVSVTSSGAWEITDIPDWIDVSLSSSEKGECSFKVGANCENPDLSTDRTATLSVVSVTHRDAGRSVHYDIPVKQRKYTFEIIPEGTSTVPAYKSNASEPTFFATVQATVDWEIVECPSWITADVTSGDGMNDVRVNFTPLYNLTRSSRSGQIKVRSRNEDKGFTVNQDAFVFDNESKSFDVKVMNTKSFSVEFAHTAEAEWTVNCPSWLKPSALSGQGSGNMTFTPEPNPNLTERTGVAYIHSNVLNEDKTITFTQEKYVFDSKSESCSFTELAGKSEVVSVTSSGPWTVSDAPSWLNLSRSSGSGTSEIVVKALSNTSLSSRSARFNIVSTLNGLSKTVYISQDAFKFDSSPVQFSYGTLEERSDAFDVLCSGRWVANDVPSWVSMSAVSGSGSEKGVKQSVRIQSSRNLTEQDRSCVVRIVSSDNPSLVKEVSLRQDKFDFRIDKEEIAYTSPLDVSERVFNVVCPAGWKVSCDDTWVSTSVSSGSGNGSVTVVPQRNLTLSDRSATVTVTSTLNSLTRKLIISQPKFLFEVDKDIIVFDSPTGSDNEAVSVAVNCSDAWTVTTDASWLILSANSGSGNGSFTIAPTNNGTKSERTAVVKVKSTLNSIEKEIHVTQKAAQ